MLQNYYTLIKLKDELHFLIGKKLIQLFSQDKNTIVLDFFDGDQEFFLHYNDVPFSTSLFINNNLHRAKNNSVDICPELLGNYLQDVVLTPNERIMELIFLKYKIICHIFGGGNANLYICNDKNKVIYAANNDKNAVGLDYREIKKNAIHNSNINNFNIIDYLTKGDGMLGKIYAIEFCKRNGWSEEYVNGKFINGLSAVERADLDAKLDDFVKYLLNQEQYYILQDKNNVKIFSLIPLQGYEIVKSFDTISEALKTQCVHNLIERRKSEILKELLPKLRRDEKKIVKTLEICSNINESLDRAAKYKLFADLLISQQNLKQHLEHIELADWDGNIVDIPLEIKLTLLDNANKYYNKSRKSLEEASYREKRLPLLQEKLINIQNAINRIATSEYVSDLEKIRKEFIKKSIVIMQTEPRSMDTKFRKFDIGDGYTLYVGKNAANNDELTLNFAKPNDIWLHSKAVSGSHCVVRSPDGKIPKPILTRAAEIACFYSGAKNAKFAPVVWTLKKYVRKPKGANPGAVILQKETTIMVEPKAPETI